MSYKSQCKHRTSYTAWPVVACMMLAMHVHAQYSFSEGLYRIGYEDDITAEVTNDMWSHSPPGKYDIVTSTEDPYVVAAAPGWIRGIQDSYFVECHEEGEPCCWWYNNYVIIEHPNGEWRKYTHMQQYSVSDLGLEVNDWVETGDLLGIEGSVGCSTGPHLHFEVAHLLDPEVPFDFEGGDLNGENLIPVICGLLPEQSFMLDEESYDAGPCDPPLQIRRLGWK